MNDVEQTNFPWQCKMSDMSGSATPGIVAVERLSEGIMVKFADGSCIFYSAKLLYTSKDKAEPQDEKLTTW